MLTIEDNVITLTRGDTAYITVAVDGYTAAEGDIVYFSVKQNISDEEYAFQVSVEASADTTSFTFEITPDLTKDLEYGKYYYDVQISTASGEIYTIVEKTAFKLTEEVTI